MHHVPLQFEAQRWATLPRHIVDRIQSSYPIIDAMRTRVPQQPGSRIGVLPTGHFPMVSIPKQLAQLLLTMS